MDTAASPGTVEERVCVHMLTHVHALVRVCTVYIFCFGECIHIHACAISAARVLPLLLYK